MLAFGFVVTASFIPVLAAGLVNINTADSAELQTLTGIGEVKAQAIIDYRTQNGPFQTIEEIKNVSGIGDAIFNNIKDYITVGSESTTQADTSPTQTEGTTSSSTTTQTSTSSEVPPVTAVITAPAVSLAGAGSYFSGKAFGIEEEPVVNARYIWTFGDGAEAEGENVLHTYAYPGEYVLVLTVASGYSTGRATLTLKVVAPQVGLVSENDQALLVTNGSAQALDIGFWELQCPAASFLIPERTTLLAQGGVRFAPTITGLACGTQAKLIYPSGAVAAEATLSGDSPLHGQPVLAGEISSTQTVRAAPAVAVAQAAAPAAPEPQPSSKVVLDAPKQGLLAAAGAALPSGIEWLVALAALVLIGAAGVFIAQSERRSTKLKNETKSSVNEFEIVEN